MCFCSLPVEEHVSVLLPLGPSYNLNILAYDPENIYLLGACSGTASSLKLGGQCSMSSGLLSPVIGYHRACFLWQKKSSSCWHCTGSYRFEAWIPKYIKYGLNLMTYEVTYDSSFMEREYSWTWYSSSFDRYTGGKKTSIAYTATSLSLLAATPAITRWMR